MPFLFTGKTLSGLATQNAFFIVLAVLALIPGCQQPSDDLLELTGKTMGTTYSLRIVPNPSVDINIAKLKRDIKALLENQNQLFSTYQTDSLISRFNRSVSDQWFKVTPEFLHVLKHAKELNRISRGAFDPSSAGLIDLWGFGNQTRLTIPNKYEIETQLQQTGLQLVEINESGWSIRKILPKLSLDFSAIAKGHAVDQIHRYLSSLNLSNHIIEIGGEVYASGMNSSGDFWRVKIDKAPITHPFNTIPLHNAAIATSGNYRNYFYFEGKTYSHLIDPRNGYPIQNELISTTIISDTTMKADGLATTLMVLGKDAAIDFCQEHEIRCFLVFREETTNQTQVWTNF